MVDSTNSRDYEYSTLEYFKYRVPELELQLNAALTARDYYQTELAKAHELLGRVLHQLSERWDLVNLTKYYPTDIFIGREPQTIQKEIES